MFLAHSKRPPFLFNRFQKNWEIIADNSYIFVISPPEVSIFEASVLKSEKLKN